MIRTLAIFLALAAFITTPNSSSAEVFKRKCPYSCSMLGISKSHCKDWKEGGKCVVDIRNGASGSGKTTLKKKCPLSCSSMGIPKSRCKDWKEKDRCVVQF